MIYLSDVNENSGPFAYIDPESNEKKTLVGVKGTTVFFRSFKIVHSASNTVSNERSTVSFLVYPFLSDKNVSGVWAGKPNNYLCQSNPFSTSLVN